MEFLFANTAVWVSIAFAIVVIIVIFKTAIVVPQQSAYVIESLGKYSRTMRAGFHILIPFIENAAYKHSLKELALDIPEQVCITKDNVQVGVDGVLYMQVMDPERASYGITDFVFAISQLAQTTLRSEIGKIDLDLTQRRASGPLKPSRLIEEPVDPIHFVSAHEWFDETARDTFTRLGHRDSGQRSAGP